MAAAALNDGLDHATNFMTGWSDGLTGGMSQRLRQMVGIDGHVQYNSAMYGGGEVVGAIHSFALGVAGGGACNVTWAKNVIQVYDMSMAAWGAYQVYGKWRAEHSLTWTDYLAFLPVAGHVLIRAGRFMNFWGCFEAQTAVAVGWRVEALAAMDAGASDLPSAVDGPGHAWNGV